ncbi:unnamed protein product [Pipistrellus nathusii]|uniref:Uncharacterized protein n=1 Tax=Pipistrellus nathusii TaxID=59473 RepID=A0ABN9ZSQ8_PIPNA
MGATEPGGSKSRRLLSSLRPWKAARRLWRTRSAPKAAQGECGRGRGPGAVRGRCPPPRAAARAAFPDPGLRAGAAWPGGPAGRSCSRPSAAGTRQVPELTRGRWTKRGVRCRRCPRALSAPRPHRRLP